MQKSTEKIKNISIADVLIRGNGFEGNKEKVIDGLYKWKKLSVDIILGTREIFYRFKNWNVILISSVIVMCMILIPINIISTFESSEFITYMGSSINDIMIEIKNGEKLQESYDDVKELLHNDRTINDYYEYRSVCVQTEDSEGENMNLHVECGENAGDGLRYLEGRTPEKENEIAISALNADKIGKNSGDILVLMFNGKEKEAVISGVYQDITSGGYTAKSKYTFTVDIKQSEDVEKKADEWSGILQNGVAAHPMKEFINQTLGGVINQLKTIVWLIIIIAAALELLIITLCLRLRLAMDMSQISALKAIGFSNKDVTIQYIIKVGTVSFIGIITGIFITRILGSRIIDAALSIASLGIKRIEFIFNPLIEYIASPLILIIFILCVTWMVMKIIKKYSITSVNNE